MNYNYTKIYNKHWQKFMDECQIDSVGIIRKDENGNKQFGFSNVFADDDSPYDFCARIGYTILRELQQNKVVSLDISKGMYTFPNKVMKKLLDA